MNNTQSAAEELFLAMVDNPDKVDEAFELWLNTAVLDMDPYSDPIQDAKRIATIAFQMGRVYQAATK